MAQMSEVTGEVVEGRQRDCLEERAMGLGPMMGVRDGVEEGGHRRLNRRCVI